MQLLIAVLVVMLIMSQRAQCPVGSYVEGVRSSGESTCVSTPPNDGCGEPYEEAPICPESRREPIRIYCTGGAEPIVIDHRTIGCQRR